MADQGIHRPLDQIFDRAGRQKCEKTFSIQKRQPVGREDDVADDDHNEFGCEDPRKRELLFIEEQSVEECGQHGIKGKTGHEAAVRFQHEFDHVHRASEETADDRAEEVVHEHVRDRAEADL